MDYGTIKGLTDLSDDEIKKLRDEYSLTNIDDIALLDKADIDEILGTEKNTLMKRRRLSAISRFLRMGGTITASTTIEDVLQKQGRLQPETAATLVEEEIQGSNSGGDRAASGDKNDMYTALRQIGICTEQIQPKETITYSAKEFLHRLPSEDSIQPKFDRKSTLSMKVKAVIWAVIAVTYLSTIAPVRSFLIYSTGWGVVIDKVHILHSFNLDHNASISADSETFTYRTATEEQYVGKLSDLLEGYRGSMDDFQTLYPPGSKFTIYYDPADPADYMLRPMIHVNDFVTPIFLFPVACLWLIICFQWILNELSMKGAQQPVYMEKLSSDGALETNKNKGVAYELAQTSQHEEYRIVLKKSMPLDLFLPLIGCFSLFFSFFAGIFCIWIQPTLLVVVFIFWEFMVIAAILPIHDDTGDVIVLDRTRGILRHKAINIEMQQIRDVQLKISCKFDKKHNRAVYRYDMTLVYLDKDDPQGKIREHKLSSRHLQQRKSVDEVIQILIFLLKSQPCLSLSDETNL